MAKKDKIENQDEESVGSKLVSAIVVIVIIVIWLVVLIVLVKMDVGGFGTKVLRPVLKDVPVINMILPPADDEEAARETDLPYTTLQQALDRITELEKDNKSLTSQLEDAQETISDKDSEISRLKVFEENQAAFEEEKENFYNEVVYGQNAPDADTYSKWYSLLDPENAERIYRQVVQEEAKDNKYKELATTYAAMKPQEAATILQEMGDDLTTVAAILSAMSAEERGAILGKMDAAFAANVTKKLTP